MISEWSKLQQMTEEANESAQLTADLATLGLTDMWARLTEVATLLRDKLTQRSSELPAQKAMKQAREAIYPEYRTLVAVLNAYALVDADTTRFQALIAALNNNIDYVRVHAMKDGGETQGQGGGSSDGGSQDGGGSDVTPVTPDNGSSNSGSGSSTGGSDWNGDEN